METLDLWLLVSLSSLLQASFAKETYHFKKPTNRSHLIFRLCPDIWVFVSLWVAQDWDKSVEYMSIEYMSVEYMSVEYM